MASQHGVHCSMSKKHYSMFCALPCQPQPQARCQLRFFDLLSFSRLPICAPCFLLRHIILNVHWETDSQPNVRFFLRVRFSWNEWTGSIFVSWWSFLARKIDPRRAALHLRPLPSIWFHRNEERPKYWRIFHKKRDLNYVPIFQEQRGWLLSWHP